MFTQTNTAKRRTKNENQVDFATWCVFHRTGTAIPVQLGHFKPTENPL
jgi:hypothetical protein